MKIDKTIYNIISGYGIGNLPGMYKLFIYLYSLFCGKEIDANGHKFIVTKYSKPRTIMYHLQGHEPHVTTTLESLIKESMIVADVGAALGYFTLIAARGVGENGKVYAIEPDKCVYDDLKKNIEINNYRNVIPIQGAVSDSNKDFDMLAYDDWFDKSWFDKTWFDRKSNLTTVNAITLDSLGVDFDLIKMDIEGYEVEAFRGMKNLLSKGKVKIICEVHPSLISELGYDISEIENILRELGYSAYLIKEDGKLVYTEKIGDAHYLFTK